MPDKPIKFLSLKAGDVFYFRGYFDDSNDGYYMKINRYNHPESDEAVNLQNGSVCTFTNEAQVIIPDSIEWNVTF